MNSKELNNLLSLIFQDGRTTVVDGRLLVPSEIAKRFGDQIRRFKPQIMVAFGCCPQCGGELVFKVEESWLGHTGRHLYCPTVGHEDKWEF